jgi:phage gpG-like protein
MSFSVFWSPIGPLQLADEFVTWNKNIKSMREPLERIIREVAIPSIKEQFTNEGVPPWRPLSEFTVNKKGHDRILWETGELEKQAAYIKNWTVRGPEGAAYLDNLNPKVSYGYLHNKGFTNWKTGDTTVARVWARFAEDDAAKAEDIVWDFLNERATKDLRMAVVGVG